MCGSGLRVDQGWTKGGLMGVGWIRGGLLGVALLGMGWIAWSGVAWTLLGN